MMTHLTYHVPTRKKKASVLKVIGDNYTLCVACTIFVCWPLKALKCRISSIIPHQGVTKI